MHVWLIACVVPGRHAHMMGASEQFAYCDFLAEASGADVPKLPSWRKTIYCCIGDNKRRHPDSYRDDWSDLEEFEEAQHSMPSAVAAALAQTR